MTDQDSGAITEAAAQSTENVQDQRAESQHVPLEALQAERRERQRLQEEFQTFKEHMNLMNLQQQMLHEKHKEPEEEYKPDDVLTYADFQKLAGSYAQKQDHLIGEMRFAQKNPDYAEVVTKYLPEVLKSNPTLRRKIESTQDYELAYIIAKQSDGYRKDQEAKVNPSARKALESSREAGNLSQVGSPVPSSQHQNYKMMSDSDFMKQVQRNMGYV